MVYTVLFLSFNSYVCPVAVCNFLCPSAVWVSVLPLAMTRPESPSNSASLTPPRQEPMPEGPLHSPLRAAEETVPERQAPLDYR